ncbi:MAG: hypothetical protein WA609_06285 [Terriglobales bacterium]
MSDQLPEQLIGIIEKVLIENRALRALLVALRVRVGMPSQAQMDAMIAQAKQTPEILESVRQQVAPLRDRIASEHDLEQVLQEFLRVAPAKKDVN